MDPFYFLSFVLKFFIYLPFSLSFFFSWVFSTSWTEDNELNKRVRIWIQGSISAWSDWVTEREGNEEGERERERERHISSEREKPRCTYKQTTGERERRKKEITKKKQEKEIKERKKERKIKSEVISKSWKFSNHVESRIYI